jgi:hypothetical protein
MAVGIWILVLAVGDRPVDLPLAVLSAAGAGSRTLAWPGPEVPSRPGKPAARVSGDALGRATWTKVAAPQQMWYA